MIVLLRWSRGILQLQVRHTAKQEADDRLKYRRTLTAILSCVVAGPINISLMSLPRGTLFVSDRRVRHALRGGTTIFCRTMIQHGVLTFKTSTTARANSHHRLDPKPRFLHNSLLNLDLNVKLDYKPPFDQSKARPRAQTQLLMQPPTRM
ncbi:hypothetical protein KVT40_006093 [Elsinoe batatas]|uniref:Uncharacterized protein n=1 Tax=Elsinoe batatas TaxID=2601811 RepID=A0A8K0KY57_9PEZI|nr:hypothetical protein KVT40_006093 [Elsinoe batatas]